MVLSDSELWQRIRELEGETVYTIQQCKPNKILRVTGDRLEIEGRATKPSREDILCVYQYLQRTGKRFRRGGEAPSPIYSPFPLKCNKGRGLGG